MHGEPPEVTNWRQDLLEDRHHVVEGHPEVNTAISSHCRDFRRAEKKTGHRLLLDVRVGVDDDAGYVESMADIHCLRL